MNVINAHVVDERVWVWYDTKSKWCNGYVLTVWNSPETYTVVVDDGDDWGPSTTTHRALVLNDHEYVRTILTA